MQISLKKDDIIALNIFLIKYSKTAIKQRIIGTYAIAFEFILVGLFVDGIFKLVPIASLVSLFFAIIWLIFYPKFYNKMRAKQLKNAYEINVDEILMKFDLDENFVTFCEVGKNDKFPLNNLKTIDESQNNIFLGFKKSIYIVLPKTDEIYTQIKELSSKFKIPIMLKSVEITEISNPLN